MLNGSHLENRHFYLCSVGHTTLSFIFFSMENAVVAALLFIFYCICINPFHSRWRGLEWCSITALLVGQSRDRLPVVPLDFSLTYSFRPLHGPWVDSAPNENEYKEHFLGVKAAGA
jgi:hypothetical protein